MVDKKTVKRILEIYEEAWVGQDIEKILSIFKKGGVYHENVLKKAYKGHKEIANYWRKKVVKEQSDIKFKLLNYYICGNVVIAEWDASFKSNIKKARIHIREVAILEIKGNKIKSLREYWQAERV